MEYNTMEGLTLCPQKIRDKVSVLTLSFYSHTKLDHNKHFSVHMQCVSYCVKCYEQYKDV